MSNEVIANEVKQSRLFKVDNIYLSSSDYWVIALNQSYFLLS